MSEQSANPAHPKTAVILICHGSRNPAANEAHRDLCEQVGQAIGTEVWPAFLELEQPDLAQAIAERVSDGDIRIRVMPYFLHPGNHTTRDIPELIDAAREAHKGINITVGELFGSDPAVVPVLAAQAQRMLA